jgi:hypothetical protein
MQEYISQYPIPEKPEYKKVRYIRDWSHGNNKTVRNQWLEIKALERDS